MKSIFKNKTISAVYAILPETTKSFDSEMRNGTSERNQRIKNNMGYGQRYRAKASTTTSMLCIRGLNELISRGVVCREEIGAVIVSSFSPDYFVPHVSNLIQAECELPDSIFTMDVWDGCAGYLCGLFQAFMLLEKLGDKKVLLFAGDVFNRLPNDNSEELYDTPPYGGDGASITVLENTTHSNIAPVIIRSDGKQRELVAIKAGAFKDLFHRNIENRAGVLSDPGASFRYFQSVVPECMSEVLDMAGKSFDDISGFSIIQANALAGRKFADRFDISYDRVPLDLVASFGDLSAALNAVGIIRIMEGIKDDALHNLMIIGYGSGAKYGAAIVELRGDISCGFINTDL